MALTLRTSARTAMISALITDAGSGAKIKLYNGTKPSALGTPGGALLATLTASGNLGTASAGVLDFDEASFSQSNGSHVSGTPTFARITTSADAAVADIDIGSGGGNWQFTGSVVTGQNVALTALSFTAGN